MTNPQTSQTGPGRPEIGKPFQVRFDDDLRNALDSWREAKGLSRSEAVRVLVAQALQASAERTMWEVFPEADRSTMTTAELHELVQGEIAGGGEACEYEWDGRSAQYYYSQVRGQWFYEFSEPGTELDERGNARWEYTWTLCASRDEAKARYREAIIAASQAWRPEEGRTMWGDGWDETFNEFEADGAIPLGTFDTAAAEAAAADALHYPDI